MPSLTFFNVRFTPSWLMILLTLVVVGGFTHLGFWQMQRAQQKQQMIEADLLFANKESSEWRSESKLPLQYQRLHVVGNYLQSIFLLDNQHQEHQFGFDVLSPLLLENGFVVLIDRGWVAGDNARKNFPVVSTPTERLTVYGSVYYPDQKQWVLGPAVEKQSTHLTIIEKLDVKIVSQILQKKVYPFIIRLDKGDEHGFVRQWAIVSMPPERHLAYAWQWFSMAIAVLIIFLALNLKKNEKTNN